MTTKLRKPIGLVARAASSKQIDLRWDPAPPSAGVVTYLIERSEPGSSAKSGFVQIAAAAATHYTDSKGLFSETKYGYRVRSANIVGDVSAYSDISVAETRPRQPALKEYYDKVQAEIARNPNSIDHDTLCQLKAIEATLNASNKKGWPGRFCGIGWETDVHFAVAGYEAAKAATHKPELGPLGDFLFYTARARIWETALEEADSSAEKRSHKKGAKKPQVHRFSSGKGERKTIGGKTPITLGEVVMATHADPTTDDSWERADAQMTVDKLLKGLLTHDAKLLRLRIGEEATLGVLASEAGSTTSTVDRHVEKLLGEMRRAVQNEALV